MPKLGLKCFLGSFLLSLAAVFAVTKAYFVMSLSEQKQSEIWADNIPAKNIELFAANEENDPLYDKFNELNKHETLPSSGDTVEVQEYHDVLPADDAILYTPEHDTSVADSNKSNIDVEAQDMENNVYAGFDINFEHVEEISESDELQIADAASAPTFSIPLIHNYKTENGIVTISDSADENQIAFASSGNIDNLGTDSAAAVTEPLMDNSLIGRSEFTAGLSAPQMEEGEPWEIAEISNKHAGKNSFDVYAAKHKDEIVAPDQEPIPQEPAVEEYKMQQNILIPIPEDIMNERNLTPQFSTSEENLRLERELREKHQLPALPTPDDNNGQSFQPATGDDGELDFEEEDEETSKSLSESIAEWFSSTKKKTNSEKARPTNNKQPQKGNAKQGQKAGNRNTGSSDGSIFSKLLGIGKESDENIVPSELKLSFQPNRAEISGQTLEWLHAFSNNSIENEDVFIEIRIDKAAPYALQEKRLKLLYKILANNGVDYHKINIIFTDREPNSFIIRNVRYASENDKVKAMKRADNPWY